MAGFLRLVLALLLAPTWQGAIVAFVLAVYYTIKLM